MEFALSPSLCTYAGGLGVLAGDIVHEASDHRLPMIAVGLGYRDALGTNPLSLGLHLDAVLGNDGHPLSVIVPIQDRAIVVTAYKWTERSVPVYLLTTDVEGNSVSDRAITEHLYPEDKERRLQQEMVLGIGGLRILEAMKIHPVVFHLNEGHSAMLALELAQHEMRERHIGFSDAIQVGRARVVFTNHTLVAAGQDIYSNDMVAANLAKYAQEFGVPVQEIVRLGLVQESSLFSMTMLSLRLSSRINAVSELHATKAAEIWADHPMIPITNGVRVATWDRLQIQSSNLKTQIWESHIQNKRKLLEYVEKTTKKKWSEHVLLLGWGRRIVSYKRPLSLFFDPQRFCDMARREERPIRVIMSGDVHAGDEEGALLRRELDVLLTGPVGEFVAFLPDYNLEIAGLMTAGSDVWLNTPIVGFEACGTSGMKASLNGVLACSTKDGWIAEIDLPSVGWALDSDKVSESLIETLEKEISPMFFNENKEQWIAKTVAARELVLGKFTSTRVLKEYIEKLYKPSIEGAFPGK